MLVLLSRWRVDVAWIGVLALGVSHPTERSILMAMPVLGTGVALRTWARGYLDRAERIAMDGPYAVVRHPLYVGSFCIAVAFALMTRVWILPFLIAAAFGVMYVPKGIREEAYLRRRFGAAYDEYARHVGAVVPTWRRAPRASAARFDWHRVMRHREWQTWLGVVALLGVMCALAGWCGPNDNLVGTVASAFARPHAW